MGTAGASAADGAPFAHAAVSSAIARIPGPLNFRMSPPLLSLLDTYLATGLFNRVAKIFKRSQTREDIASDLALL